MGTESENNFETVVIEGEVWAVTSPDEESPTESMPPTTNSEADANIDGEQTTGSDDLVDSTSNDDIQDEAGVVDPVEGQAAAADPEEVEFDALQALTKLFVGGAIEGTSQLTRRLQDYEEQLRQEVAERAADDEEFEALDEDELVRLRYAMVGLIFDAQDTFWRSLTMWAKLADKSARATNKAARPVTNSFLFNPVRRRYDRLVKRGESRFAKWIADGRENEAPSRDLARTTYVNIVDEFIDRLAQNPELQSVITQQSIGVASDMRDEVRERTVTADNLMEGIVRRILRRTPRGELPEPPPEVQRWAGRTLEEYRAEQKVQRAKDEDTTSS